MQLSLVASSHRQSYGRCGGLTLSSAQEQHGHSTVVGEETGEDDVGHCRAVCDREREREGGREVTSVCPAPSTARARLSWLTVAVCPPSLGAHLEL